MGYKWDGHRETCYQLYIVERKSMYDIMEHMRTVHKFAPSKRAFQLQFHRWGFPSKHKPAHKNEELVSRIKELWEKNLPQAEILRVLNEEDGFDIKHREVMRVRRKHRWLLRLGNGERLQPLQFDDDGTASIVQRQTSTLRQAPTAASTSRQRDMDGLGKAAESPGKKQSKRASRPVLSSGLMKKFPSEMTNDAARAILKLDKAEYGSLRSTFEGICQEEGIMKKTIAGVEKWEAAKTRLISEMPHLQGLLWTAKDNPESKKLALEVICTDVTKRLRTLERRMTLTQAKNVLGVNPEEARQLRVEFHEVLRDARFTCKSSATPQQWEDLRRRWSEQSVLARRVLVEANMVPSAGNKVQALETVARDVMKRLLDERTRRVPQESERIQKRLAVSARVENIDNIDLGEPHSSSPADQMDMGDGMVASTFDDTSVVSPESQMDFSPPKNATGRLHTSLRSQRSNVPQPRAVLQRPSRVLRSSMHGAMALESQMDASLLLGAGAQATFMDEQYVQQQFAPAPVFQPVQAPVWAACAMYLRLHPSSSFSVASSIWIATLSSPALQDLRQTAVEKFPGAVCVRVEGILKDGKGGELPLQIVEDQELAAYLAHLQGAAPTFNVQLVWKTS